MKICLSPIVSYGPVDRVGHIYFERPSPCNDKLELKSEVARTRKGICKMTCLNLAISGKSVKM